MSPLMTNNYFPPLGRRLGSSKTNYFSKPTWLRTETYKEIDNILSWTKVMKPYEQKPYHEHVLDTMLQDLNTMYPHLSQITRGKIKYKPENFLEYPGTNASTGGWSDLDKNRQPFVEFNTKAFKDPGFVGFTLGHEIAHLIQRHHPEVYRGDVWHEVKPGENLTSITRHWTGNGDNWRDLYTKNRGVIGENPNFIRAGAFLRLPSSWSPWEKGPNDDGSIMREFDATIRDVEGSLRSRELGIKPQRLINRLHCGDHYQDMLHNNSKPEYTSLWSRLWENQATRIIPESIENRWKEVKRKGWQEVFQTPGMLDLPQFKPFISPTPQRWGPFQI